jgi:tetratricopeptide (TPR) repeat protein
MKRLTCLLLLIVVIPLGAAQGGRRVPPSSKPAATAKVSRPANSGAISANDQDFNEAQNLIRAGKYAEASQKLFALSYSPRYRDKRMQIKYVLGLALQQLKLNQVAAFQYIGVVKEGNNKFIKQSLERLSLAADSLGDDTLLNYAISRVNVDEFPRVHRDMLYFRIGEYLMRNKQFEQAARSFEKVSSSSNLYAGARYQQGLSLAELNQLDRSVAAFDEIIQYRSGASVTDKVRLAALMGKARALYQRKSWDQAIETYREIPRDSEFWHDTVFESSWAMLRSGRFRSSLSNFQTLHSAFYEEFYLPESLLLRAIVYLYICKYDEMDKVLTLFNSIYKPVYDQINKTLEMTEDPNRYFNMINEMMKAAKRGDSSNMSTAIPYIVAQKITREADFQGSFQYIRKLLEERNRIQKLPGGWSSSAVGQYAMKVLNTRINKAKEKAGKIVRNHLLVIREELVDQIEQEGFARYEMINGRKESLKKRIAGKDLPAAQVDESNKRDYYIQNGYEYWPFSGEYWLDELGNYHYVGTQSCN